MLLLNDFICCCAVCAAPNDLSRPHNLFFLICQAYSNKSDSEALIGMHRAQRPAARCARVAAYVCLNAAVAVLVLAAVNYRSVMHLFRQT